LEEQLDRSIDVEDAHRTLGRPLRVGAKTVMIVARCHHKIDRDRTVKKAHGALKTNHFRETEYTFRMILKMKLEKMTNR